MKIGIVIPCYNDAKYVDDCLRSIDYPVEHIVIVNDASPYEDMKEKLREIKNRNIPNLTILEHEVNRKSAAVKNTGIKYLLVNTDVELIVTLDADDCLAWNWLETVDAAFSSPEGQQVDIISGICHTRHNLLETWFPQGLFHPNTNNGCPSSSTVFKRKVFERLLFDESMVLGDEDWDLINRCVLECFTIRPIQHSALIYRMKESNESRNLQSVANKNAILTYMHKVYRDRYGINV